MTDLDWSKHPDWSSKLSGSDLHQGAIEQHITDGGTGNQNEHCQIT